MDSGLLVILIFGAMMIVERLKPIPETYTREEMEDIVLQALRQYDEDTAMTMTIYDNATQDSHEQAMLDGNLTATPSKE